MTTKITNEQKYFKAAMEALFEVSPGREFPCSHDLHARAGIKIIEVASSLETLQLVQRIAKTDCVEVLNAVNDLIKEHGFKMTVQPLNPVEQGNAHEFVAEN